MAKYTTNFLTWLKGLFHTKTEVDNLLETKINTVDVQGKITSFTNKDRINIERLINYMDNSSGSDYYTLDLKGARGTILTSQFSDTATSIFSDDKNRLAITNSTLTVDGIHFVLGGMIYKNGVAQTSDSTKITFKLIDGTVIGESTTKLNSTSSNQSMKQYTFYQELWGSNPSYAWNAGIYYIYAEATISGSVYKSNILSVFVKENQNLLDMNLWAGGNYDNSLTNIQCNQDNQKIIISTEWSDNGETSFKITRGGGTGYNWCRFRYLSTEAGQTITAKLKVYSTTAEADIWLCDINGSTEGSHNGVRIYPSPKTQEIILTFTGKLSTVTSYAIRVNLLYDDTCLFIDDIELSN